MPVKITRRAGLAVGALAVAAAAAWPTAGALGLTGGTTTPPPRPPNAAANPDAWTPAPGAQGQVKARAGATQAFVALSSQGRIAQVDVATHTIVATRIRTDAARGVAVTPDGRKVYVADTGQYDVAAVDASSGAAKKIFVGPYPQAVAVTPDGRAVYAAVTGGDTGAGGSDEVKVIDTAADRVTQTIKVGTAPHQIAFSRDGHRAYVTYAGGVGVVDTGTGKVVRKIADPGGAQGVAVTPDGRTLLVTNPRAGDTWLLDAASGKVRAKVSTPDQPWGVAVTPDGRKAYVARMNAGSVAVLDLRSRKVTGQVRAGKLPAPVAITPDGKEAWVGNVFSGGVSVIDTASDRVTTTIVGGTGTKPINAAPQSIAFAPTP
ncbi:YncE family protein [Actinomadura gamaensis]|uniref:YncE family protein n=1 Tax=Actinomadura gamaensis TaxID=1763541 RepID=A0ABV9TWT1_9ACTN